MITVTTMDTRPGLVEPDGAVWVSRRDQSHGWLVTGAQTATEAAEAVVWHLSGRSDDGHRFIVSSAGRAFEVFVTLHCDAVAAPLERDSAEDVRL